MCLIPWVTVPAPAAWWSGEVSNHSRFVRPVTLNKSMSLSESVCLLIIEERENPASQGVCCVIISQLGKDSTRSVRDFSPEFPMQRALTELLIFLSIFLRCLFPPVILLQA